MTRIATLVVLLALCTPAPAQVTASLDPAKPRLRSEAHVTGNIVRIGDLVENAGIVADIPIFQAPDLGDTGAVPAARVIEAVRAHAIVGLNSNGISEVMVTRLSRAIPAKEIEARIAGALASQYSLGEAKDLTLNFDRELRTLHVEPSTNAGLRIARLNYEPRNGRFDIAFDAPGGNERAIRFTGSAVMTTETLMLTHPVNRGEVLKHADVTIQRRPKAEIGNDIIGATETVIGLAARRSLRPGQPLRIADLMKPELVMRDATVTLVYEIPGITLTVRGKALEGGAEGDLIAVLNTQSKRTVQGTVSASGHVIVASTMPRIAAKLEPSPVPSNAPSERAE